MPSIRGTLLRLRTSENNHAAAESAPPEQVINVIQPGRLTRLARHGRRLKDAIVPKSKPARPIGMDEESQVLLKKNLSKCRKGLLGKLFVTMLAGASLATCILLTAGTAGAATPLLACAIATLAISVADTVCAVMEYRNANALLHGKPPPHSQLPMGTDSIANLLFKSLRACGISEVSATRAAVFGSLVLRLGLFAGSLGTTIAAATTDIPTTYGPIASSVIASASTFAPAMDDLIDKLDGTLSADDQATKKLVADLRAAHQRFDELEIEGAQVAEQLAVFPVGVQFEVLSFLGQEGLPPVHMQVLRAQMQAPAPKKVDAPFEAHLAYAERMGKNAQAYAETPQPADDLQLQGFSGPDAPLKRFLEVRDQAIQAWTDIKDFRPDRANHEIAALNDLKFAAS